MRRAGIGIVTGLAAAVVVLCAWPAQCGGQEVIRFDPQKLQVKADGAQWKLMFGDVVVKILHSEQAAKDGLAVIQSYGMDSRAVLGPMEWFLVKDQAPTAANVQAGSPIDPMKIQAQKIQNAWKVVDGDHWLLDFGDNENQARQGAELIRKYGFTHVCYVTSPAKEMAYFVVEGKAAATVAQPHPATAVAPPVPAPAGGKAVLTVRVIEGTTTPAKDPTVTVRPVGPAGGAPEFKTENPAVFNLPAGAYEVTAKVGAAGDTPLRWIELAAGQTRELVIRTGTGTLEAKFTAGRQALKSLGVVELRSGGKMVSGLSDTTVKFQAMEGPYSLRVGLGCGQYIDIDGLVIEAGKISTHEIDVPCATLRVKAKGGAYAGGKLPYVQVDAAGRMVAAVVDSPAKFQLLAGTYSVFVQEDGKKLGMKWIEIKPGQDQDIELDVTAANEEPPKAEPEKPWRPASQPGRQALSKPVTVFTTGGELASRGKGEATTKPVAAGAISLKSGTQLEASKAPVNIVFENGTRLSLDAGTKVCVGLYENGMMVAQKEGRSWHSVIRPKGKEFFYTVVTPSQRFTALGTEFGVTILTPGSSYVCVYEGDLVPRGTQLDENGRPIPVYEYVPDAIRCGPPPEAQRTSASGCEVDGVVHELVRITDNQGRPISSTSEVIVGQRRCSSPSAGDSGTVGAGQQGTFPAPQELRPAPGAMATGAKPQVGPISQPDSWAQRNRQLSRDLRELQRQYDSGEITQADYAAKLRGLMNRAGQLLAGNSVRIEYDPNGPLRVDVEALRYVLNRCHNDAQAKQSMDAILPGGVAALENLVRNVNPDGTVPESQRVYVTQLMTALGVPFVGQGGARGR